MKKILPFFIACIMFSSAYSQHGGGDGCIRLIGVDPINNFITIVNLTSSPVDLSDYRFCSLFDYTNDLSSLTAAFGDVNNIPPDDIVILSWPLNDNAADLALYFPTGGFDEPSAMVDFMQYGSAGNGREDEAVAAGLWSAGDFVPQASAYGWAGTCFDHSSANWNTTNIESIDNSVNINMFPNPSSDLIQLNVLSSISTNGVFNIWDQTGKICLEQGVNIIRGENVFEINIHELASGHYSLILRADGIAPRPIPLIKKN